MPTAKPAAKKTSKTAAKKPAPKAAKKVTLDDVWAAIRETQAAHKETEVAIRETQEAHKETEVAMKEARIAIKEAGIAIKETQRNIGGLSNTVGSLVEHIMTPGLPGKFKQFGFTFDKITTVKWAVEGSLYAEIDGLLENGKQAMVVEVKTTLRRADIDDHLVRMEKVRRYADEHGDKREFLGAMAAMITDKDSREYALAKGFFVIEPSGEDVKVTKPLSAPRLW
ncbi:hypothetical protein FACS1894147_10880 [Spirochaetia bacterium]|nr:hypothetical protein FACS1894147_10880 [Spirochaetia bacterium]